MCDSRSFHSGLEDSRGAERKSIEERAWWKRADNAIFHHRERGRSRAESRTSRFEGTEWSPKRAAPGYWMSNAKKRAIDRVTRRKRIERALSRWSSLERALRSRNTSFALPAPSIRPSVEREGSPEKGLLQFRKNGLIITRAKYRLIPMIVITFTRMQAITILRKVSVVYLLTISMIADLIQHYVFMSSVCVSGCLQNWQNCAREANCLSNLWMAQL